MPVGSGRERLDDMEPLINLHVAKQASASRRWTLSFGEGSRRGILVISPNTALVTFWLNRGAGRRMVKRFRSIDDEDGALRCVRVCSVDVGP